MLNCNAINVLHDTSNVCSSAPGQIERLAPSLIAAGDPIGQVFEWVGGSIFLEKRTRGTSTARRDHMAKKVLIGGSVLDLGPLLHATIK